MLYWGSHVQPLAVGYAVSGIGGVHICLFIWRAKWSERENALSQRWHWNGLWPVCLRKWRVSSSDLANFQPQPSQLQ